MAQAHADRLPALLRRPAARGYYPRMEPPARFPSSKAGGREKGSEGEIAIALCVYAELVDALNLPLRPPYALARAWIERLFLLQRDAVKRAVAGTPARLHRVSPVRYEDRLPSPTGPLLEKLEKAIADGATIEMRYYTAGRDHKTTRRADPLRLEWRGQVAYLIACRHLRGEERVFRVDRIARLCRI